MLAGVAAGLAEHLRVDVRAVRLVFVLLALAGGAGLLAYAAFWVVVPLQPERGPLGTDTRRELTALISLAAVALGLVLGLQVLGVGLSPSLTVPVLLAGAGVVLLWRQFDDSQRERLLHSASAAASGPSRLVRTASGVVLVVLGGGLLVATRTRLADLRDALLAATVVLVGLALIAGPFVLRLVRELGVERSARIREQERAEIAAHLHDSVLQTLALIQRNTDSPREVARLARAQERELRAWLYRPGTGSRTTLSGALSGLVGQVEDDHGVTVELVCVGDAPLDEQTGALLQAVREALVNAAKYAGSPISVYAEVEPTAVTVFVRDRGPGFDLDLVPPDRMGVRGSILGRMQRNGGAAVLRSDSETGTEVELSMPTGAREQP